jgi:hypothetical protein
MKKALPQYIKCPCKDCTKRYLGCHDKCQPYQDYKRNNRKAKIVEENKQTYKGEIEDYQYVRISKRYT